AALDTLDKKYPKHEHQAEVLYLRYQAAVALGDLDKATQMANRLRSQYAETKYGILVKPTQVETSALDSAVNVYEFYDKTYESLQKRQYADVLKRVNQAQHQNDKPELKPKYSLIEATALAGDGQLNSADTVLNEFLKSNHNDTLVEWAKIIQDFVKKKRKDDSLAKIQTTLIENATIDSLSEK